jgi:hypothetical protein
VRVVTSGSTHRQRDRQNEKHQKPDTAEQMMAGEMRAENVEASKNTEPIPVVQLGRARPSFARDCSRQQQVTRHLRK